MPNLTIHNALPYPVHVGVFSNFDTKYHNDIAPGETITLEGVHTSLPREQASIQVRPVTYLVDGDESHAHSTPGFSHDGHMERTLTMAGAFVLGTAAVSTALVAPVVSAGLFAGANAGAFGSAFLFQSISHDGYLFFFASWSCSSQCQQQTSVHLQWTCVGWIAMGW